MKKIKLWMYVIIALIVCAHFWVSYKQAESVQNKEQAVIIDSAPVVFTENEPVITANADLFTQLFKKKQSDVQVVGEGVVIKVLADDNEGSRHQKFILGLDEGLTLLIAHNIDLAPRIENLVKGDSVKFYGEYVWNEKGGLIHWTHKDPQALHPAGFLEHQGRIYQ